MNKRFDTVFSIIVCLLILSLASAGFIILNNAFGKSGDNISLRPYSSPEESSAITALDADYSRLTLVNGDNPLPENYNYEENLATIPQDYIVGTLSMFDKDALPYLTRMLDAARNEGIEIGVWSPYRSYEVQRSLFEKQVQKQIAAGVPENEAEEKAATVVARAGSSEHHTGLAVDINCADESFEDSKAFLWLKENAEDYGFIMRYSGEKQAITGVIYESWHWRFVGIKSAEEINKLGYCLEEYINYLGVRE